MHVFIFGKVIDFVPSKILKTHLMVQDANPHKIIEKLKQVLTYDRVDEGVKIDHVRKLLLEFDTSAQEAIRSNLIGEIFKEHATAANISSASQAIKTGLEAYDAAFGGLWPGEFVVVGGRPAMGKSHFLTNIAANIAAEHEVLFYSLDNSSFMLMARIVASLSNLPVNYYRNGKLNESQQKELDAVKDDINRLKLRIVDRQAQSMGAFKALCIQHVEEFGVKVIFVDYLQLLSSNRYRNSRELEISHISRELKNLARDLNICVVATSQLSRSVEQRGGDKRPILSDLRVSGAIEQDADKVFFLYRPEYYGFIQDDMGMSNERLLELIMAKNRSGALERVRLKIDTYFTRFIPFEETNTTFEVNEDRMEDFKEVPF